MPGGNDHCWGWSEIIAGDNHAAQNPGRSFIWLHASRGCEIRVSERRYDLMENFRVGMVENNGLEWGEAGGRPLRSRLLRYLPLFGFISAALGGILGAAYFIGGKEFMNFAVAYSRRWNTAWMMLSFLASYLVAYEITDTQWFRRFGVAMMQERLQALFLALALSSFCLIIPFREAWTNYWLSRDGLQARGVVTAEGAALGYRYRVDRNEYRACCYKIGLGMAPDETVTVYYSASHPSVSALKRPGSMADGIWPVMILIGWPLEFMAIATVVSPRCKWAYRFGSRNRLPPAMRRDR